MKRIVPVLILMIVISNKCVCNAQEIDYVENYDELFLNEADLDEKQRQLEYISGEYGMDSEVSFEKLYHLLLQGDVNGAVQCAGESFCHSIIGELLSNRTLMGRLVILVVIAAIFNNYSSLLKVSFVGEQGFYITYLMASSILIKSFFLIYDVAEDTVCYIRDIMECVLPAFSMSLVFCSGITTSQMVNALFIYMLGVMEKLMLTLILPGVRIYFLIVLLNQINKKDRFSKLSELIKQCIEWMLKISVSFIVGLNVVKGMIVPVCENVRYNVLMKGIALLPGGSALSGVGNIIIGAGVLIKNCVGVTIVLVLVVMGAVPLLKILAFYISYKVILVLTQPVSDARITNGLEGACDAAEVMLKAVATSLAMCILTIAIIIMTTNVKMYSG
ncbi:MAG: stage III sporulation protein AE [Lachnospiraceae bacterium]|nr:stage III sporulation protein AE [Lachnospiraceae bacterium]